MEPTDVACQFMDTPATTQPWGAASQTNLSPPTGKQPERLYQIISQQILSGVYSAGDKLPSLRSLARQAGISKNSVVSAFERLAAHGLIEPRQGSGFYVRPLPENRTTPSDVHPHPERTMNIVWLLQTQLTVAPGQLAIGDAFMPPESMEKLRLDLHYTKIARNGIRSMTRYGDRLGYQPLRRFLSRSLGHAGIDCRTDQILLTHGANEALDLLIRHFVGVQHTVLVDDPGYYPLIAKLHIAGAHTIGIPRLPDGPCLPTLERVLAQWRPRLFFTQSVMQNPTGSAISLEKMRQLLALCKRHQVTVVDNNSLNELHSTPQSTLAELDQLARTIYISSFSKSISPALRVGYIAADTETIEALADLRTLTNISSSEYCERTVEAIITDPSYERFLKHQRQDLADATLRAQDTLQCLGAELFMDYRQSLFLWSRFRDINNTLELARALQIEDVVLAPGALFSVDFSQVSPWTRCNPFAVIHPRFATAMQAVRKRAAL